MNFFQEQNLHRKVVTITSRTSPGFWLVADSMGRSFIVASGEQWISGDTVAIVGGQIIGRAGKISNPSTYNV